MKKDLILVVGASGTVGSNIVKQLKEQGYQVRSTTSKQAKSADHVHLNLATGEGIKAAFEGVDKAFLLTPPPFADHYAILSPLIQEAKRRGLKKVVLMTAMGADASETTPFRRAELELEKSGLSYNIIRPNWFLQNFNSFWIQGILEQGKILVPAGQAKVSFIDARDISDVAVKLLTTDTHNNKAFNLSGPEAIDHHQVAQAISKATARKVTYEEIAPETLKQGLVSHGVPVDYADFLLLIFGFLKAGYNAGLTPSVKEITGHEARSVQDYASAFKASWSKTA